MVKRPTKRKDPDEKGVFVYNVILVLVLASLVALLGYLFINQESGREETERQAIEVDYTGVLARLDLEKMHRDIEYFSGLGSRVTGYEGSYRAAKAIKSRFKRLGIYKDAMTFEVPVPIDMGAAMRLPSGTKIKIHPLWPNLVRTPHLSPQGVSGHLIYAGTGKFKEFNGKKVAGSIVLMDFNSGDDWQNAFYLGAKAVVFIEPDDTSRGEAASKFLTLPLDAPRFWLPRGKAAEVLAIASSGREETVNLTCDMPWREVEAENIFGVIKGSDPELKEKWVVLTAYYDSMSVVPGLSPGAEGTTGLAFLLEMARMLKEKPPTRSVLLVALGGHHQSLAGMRALIDRHVITLFDREAIEKEANCFYRRDYRRKAAGEDKKTPYNYISLDLTTRSDRLGVFFKGWFFDQREDDLKLQYSSMGRDLKGFSKKILGEMGWPEERDLVDGINPLVDKNWRTYLAGRFAFDGEVATLAGETALTFATAFDSRNYVDTPLDEYSRLQLGNFDRQAELLACLLHKVLIDPKFQYRLKFSNAFCRVVGRCVEFDVRQSALPNTPVKNTITVMRKFLWGNLRGQKSFAGVRGEVMDIVDWETKPGKVKGEDKQVPTAKAGRFNCTGAVQMNSSPQQWGIPRRIDAFHVDETTGEVDFAPDLGTQGAQAFPPSASMTMAEKEVTVVIFRCKGTGILNLFDPRFFSSLRTLNVYDAKTDSQPQEYGYIRPIFRDWDSVREPAMVVFTKPIFRYKLTMGGGVLGLRLVMINSTPEMPEGRGYDLAGQSIVPHLILRVTEDMGRLDEYRMGIMRKHNIENARLAALHEKAMGFLEGARESLAARQYDEYMRLVRAAWALESRAYPDVFRTQEDVIKGIMFYLFLLLPFAYFMERLLVASANVNRQIGWVTAIFLAIFVILRYVHPAFDITLTPLIILLAFVIMALSVFVIYVIVSKFQEQVREFKQKMQGVHQADVGRVSAAAAAFALGISNMRKRKGRTLLTSITLVLLMFIVISFTSVRTFLRYNQVKMPQKAARQGLLIRDRIWTPMEEPAYETISSIFAKDGQVIPRAWYYSALVGDQSFIEVEHRRGGGARLLTYSANCIAGMHHKESAITGIHKCLVAGRWFREGEDRVCIIPDQMAELLKISRADVGRLSVRVYGRDFLVVGIISGKKMLKLYDLDDEQLTPVDYKVMQQKIRSGEVDRSIIQRYVHMTPNVALIMPFKTVMDMGGTLRSLAVKINPDKDIQAVIEEHMPRMALTLFAGIKGNTYLFSTIGHQAYQGLANILIPILIAALIVLNTMLGSVYERTKEIGIYSSVGLAPMHIASLFVAESSVYAVIGAITGYLAGQVVAKVLTVAGLMSGLNLNYSSMSAVGATVLVMLIVLLSTLYPASVAARLAVPDVERTWKMPEPKGGVIEMELPFTVTGRERTLGINMFLREFFDAHLEYSVGRFYTEGSGFEAIGRGKQEHFTLSLTTWLAPFDLGVSQEVQMLTKPMPDEGGVYAVHLRLKHIGGDEASWRRIVRHFMMEIRKQFLIWRTFKPDEQMKYAKMVGSVAKDE